METKVAQPPKQINRSLWWHMKYNGQGYHFCKRVLLVEVLVKALEIVKVVGLYFDLHLVNYIMQNNPVTIE